MNFSDKKGFTLVEMIVAMGIISVVLFMGVGILLMFNTIQKRTISAQNVHDNIRFAIETMSREIRTGDNFTNTCEWALGGCAEFTFRQTFTNETVIYKLDGGVVKVSRNGSAFLPITDPQRSVTNLKFYTTGVGNNNQETVTIVMEVQSGSSAKPSEMFDIIAQATVAKRKLGD